MNTRPPIMTFTPTGTEPPRRPADFLQPLARRVGEKPMTGSAPQQQEVRRLVVARGITVKGELAGCQRLTVEGRVEAALTDCQVLEVAENGVFSGTATVEQADVRGRVEGELTVLNRLLVRGSGRVSGRIRYQDLSIEQGGKLAGQVELLESGPEAVEDEAAEAPAPVTASPVSLAPAPRFALAAADVGQPVGGEQNG
jgi:cytoskeletal protein CcmA (bactofilin family)